MRNPNKDDWRKLKSLVDYLKATIDKHLIVRVDKGFNLAKWHIDASFALHENFRSHTSGILTMSSKGACLNTASLKQKFNSCSSMEVELIVVDHNVVKILWTMLFLYEQGIVSENVLYQDNESIMRFKRMTWLPKVNAHFI